MEQLYVHTDSISDLSCNYSNTRILWSRSLLHASDVANETRLGLLAEPRLGPMFGGPRRHCFLKRRFWTPAWLFGLSEIRPGWNYQCDLMPPALGFGGQLNSTGCDVSQPLMEPVLLQSVTATRLLFMGLPGSF